MNKLITTLLLLWVAATAFPTPKTDRYTVVISLDGFRWDYPQAFDCPFLARMARQGVSAVVQPSFPSKTFPNHYSMATGLYPDHHGIVANAFKLPGTNSLFSIYGGTTARNPKYFGGEPVWNTARRQGVVTATVYWVGSDVAVGGMQPNYWQDYARKPLLSLDERISMIIDLLKKPQSLCPHLIMAYFEQPDAAGHRYGPISQPTRQAIEQMDRRLAKLWEQIQALPIGNEVNLIVTGDHGMTYTQPERCIPVKSNLKSEWIDRVEGNLPALIYTKRPEFADSVVQALAHVPHLRAWKRTEIPTYLHYGTNPRIGDVVVLPDLGWLFTDSPIPANSGNHGYDPTASDMQIGFRAMGPDFRTGYAKTERFDNVNLYALICHLLGIEPAQNDGSIHNVSDMLKPQK